jgi:hypothetical protein
MAKKKKPDVALIQTLCLDTILKSGKLYPQRFTEGTSKRLKIFNRIGRTCVCCGIIATKIKKYKDRRNDQYFWSICTDDNIEMTVDHIKPKSLGGKNTIENYQPMCEPCNTKKGNGLKLLPFLDYRKDITGKELYIKVKGKFILKGIITKIDINPYTLSEEIFIESARNSSYKINKKAYINDQI